MSSSSKHLEITQWLKSIFGGEEIPSYEVTEDSLEALHGLALESQRRSRLVTKMIQSKQRQALEYRAEADRIERKLDKLNFGPGQLSKATQDLLEVIKSVAISTGLNTGSEDELALKVAEIHMKASMLPIQTQDANRDAERIQREKVITLEDIAKTKQVLNVEEVSAKKTIAEAAESKTKSNFLLQKKMEYNAKADRLQGELRKRGFAKEVDHNTILELKKELDKLSVQQEGLQSTLKSFQSLPPDVDLARVKVEEAKQELNELTVQLTQEISGVHI